jgi:hypothetical protein
MSENSWAWAYFDTDGQQQGNNKDTKRAWCKACLNVEIAALRQSDILATAGGIVQNRADEELLIAGELLCNDRRIKFLTITL